MSEFTCKNGHLMRSKDRVCLICGSTVYRMDGLTDVERYAKSQKRIKPVDCPCKGIGLIPYPDGEAICRDH